MQHLSIPHIMHACILLIYSKVKVSINILMNSFQAEYHLKQNYLQKTTVLAGYVAALNMEPTEPLPYTSE